MDDGYYIFVIRNVMDSKNNKLLVCFKTRLNYVQMLNYFFGFQIINYSIKRLTLSCKILIFCKLQVGTKNKSRFIHFIHLNRLIPIDTLDMIFRYINYTNL